jgi:hypothetical protein
MESFAMGSVIAVGAGIACWLLVIAGHPVWALLAGFGGLGLGLAGLIGGTGVRSISAPNVIAVVISITGIGLVGIMFSRTLI